MTRSRLKQAVQQGQVSQPPTILPDWLPGDQNSLISSVCFQKLSWGLSAANAPKVKPLIYCAGRTVPSSVQ